MAGRPKPPLLYYVFDLLNLEGKNLTGLSLVQRKAMAEKLIARLTPTIRFSASIKADSEALVAEMQACGLEGLIAKKKDSKYESGRRSGAWVKFKWTNEQEFIIGGYNPPPGTTTPFWVLLGGCFEKDKPLFFAKVGNGFAQPLLCFLHKKFKK